MPKNRNPRRSLNKQYIIRRDEAGIVHCERFDGAVHLELKPISVHSPTGFEFGYGGSGPAELALCILTDYLGREEANEYYQRFKWQFIAPMKGIRLIVTAEEINAWLKRTI